MSQANATASAASASASSTALSDKLNGHHHHHQNGGIATPRARRPSSFTSRSVWRPSRDGGGWRTPVPAGAAGGGAASHAPSSLAPSRPASPQSSGTFVPGEEAALTPLDADAIRHSLLGPKLHSLVTSLEERLKAQANKQGRFGSLARFLLDRGHWAEDVLYDELELRLNAIGGIDNMWLLLSETTGGSFNPVCAATYTLSKKLTLEQVNQGAMQQAESHPKYTQRLVNVGRRFHGALFVEDPDFDLAKHVWEEKLPGDAGPKELNDFMAKMIAKEWDMDKPLWETVLLSNYRDDTGAKSALAIRGHHTMSDGQGFVMSQLLATSFGPELQRLLNDGKNTLRQARRGTAQPSKLHRALAPLDRYRRHAWMQLAMFALFWFLYVITTLLDVLGSIRQATVIGFWFATTAWRQRYCTAEYQGARVGEKEFSMSDNVPMHEVKLIQRAFSGPTPGGWMDRVTGRRGKYVTQHITLNDILVTVISDVLADEMEHHEYPPLPGFWAKLKRFANRHLSNPPVGLMIPISVRAVGDTRLRNLVSGSVSYLPAATARRGLPLGPRAMHRRLHANSHSLSIMKRGFLPKLSFWAIQFTGQTPILFPSALWSPLRSAVAGVASLVLSSFCATLTNVPGPPFKFAIADAEVLRWAIGPPQAGKNTLGIGIISYADTVMITITADAVPASRGVAERLTRQFGRRWQQYVEVAKDILERAEKDKQDKREKETTPRHD